MDETSAVLSTNSAFYAAFTAKVSAAPTRLTGYRKRNISV